MKKIALFFVLISCFSFVFGTTVNVKSVSAATKTTTTKKAVKKTKKKIRYRSVSSIKGADEKNFTNSTTRCITKAITAKYNAAEAQMKKDIAPYVVSKASAVQTYKNKIDLVWEIMHEPYCGYGAYGLTAVAHSFDKSVVDTRDTFFKAVKG